MKILVLELLHSTSHRHLHNFKTWSIDLFYQTQRPYPVRPKKRNSNVLSAILCLIKEIDGPSLEVVEMAVRCRMEELED
jgi:hypothetical protein